MRNKKIRIRIFIREKFPFALGMCFLCGIILLLQACTLLTLPVTTTVLGGAQLAIKGAELQKAIRKADVQEAFDVPFEKTWNLSVIAIADLRIEVTKIARTEEGNGGLIEGQAKKIKVKLLAVEVTPDITEVGIWTDHDKALAALIAEKIREEVQKQSH